MDDVIDYSFLSRMTAISIDNLKTLSLIQIDALNTKIREAIKKDLKTVDYDFNSVQKLLNFSSDTQKSDTQESEEQEVSMRHKKKRKSKRKKQIEAVPEHTIEINEVNEEHDTSSSDSPEVTEQPTEVKEVPRVEVKEVSKEVTISPDMPKKEDDDTQKIKSDSPDEFDELSKLLKDQKETEKKDPEKKEPEKKYTIDEKIEKIKNTIITAIKNDLHPPIEDLGLINKFIVSSEKKDVILMLEEFGENLNLSKVFDIESV